MRINLIVKNVNFSLKWKMIWKLTNCQCMKKKKIVSICEFSSKKIHDLELHTITKLDNKCNFKTEPSRIFTYLKHLSGTKVFKCSDFLCSTRNSTKTRKSKNISTWYGCPMAPVTLLRTVQQLCIFSICTNWINSNFFWSKICKNKLTQKLIYTINAKNMGITALIKSFCPIWPPKISRSPL